MSLAELDDSGSISNFQLASYYLQENLVLTSRCSEAVNIQALVEPVNLKLKTSQCSFWGSSVDICSNLANVQRQLVV